MRRREQENMIIQEDMDLNKLITYLWSTALRNLNSFLYLSPKNETTDTLSCSILSALSTSVIWSDVKRHKADWPFQINQINARQQTQLREMKLLCRTAGIKSNK